MLVIRKAATMSTSENLIRGQKKVPLCKPFTICTFLGIQWTFPSKNFPTHYVKFQYVKI